VAVLLFFLKIKFPSIISIFGVDLLLGCTFWCVCLLRPCCSSCLTSFTVLKCRLHFPEWLWGFSSMFAWPWEHKLTFEVYYTLFVLSFPPSSYNCAGGVQPHSTPPHTFLIFLLSFILVLGNLYFLPLNPSWKLSSENFFTSGNCHLLETSSFR
jgi:hypothetical protein